MNNHNSVVGILFLRTELSLVITAQHTGGPTIALALPIFIYDDLTFSGNTENIWSIEGIV